MRQSLMCRIAVCAASFLIACGDDEAARDTSASDVADTSGGDLADTSDPDVAETVPSDTADVAETADSEVVSGPRVTLVLDPGGRGDRAFNDMAAAGLARAAEEVVIDPVEVVADFDDLYAPIESAALDSQLVIAVGFFFVDAVAEIAFAHPEVHFAVIDGVGPELPNVSYHDFAVEQGSFLVGAAAALTTQTRRLGFIGGVDLDIIDLFEAGFRAGVAHVGLDITVESMRLSRFPELIGFADPEAARSEALRMYAAGADVIYHAAGGSGAGLFAAAREFSDEHDDVWAIGVDVDQYHLVDEAEQPHVLTSMLKRFDEAVYRLVKDVVAGDPPSGYVLGDLAAGMVGYATSGGHLTALAAQLEALAAAIIDGTLVVPTEIPGVCTDLGAGVTSAGWTAHAGTPVRRGHSVQGCMVFLRESGLETRGGGVCLVADLNDAHPCTTAADCDALPLPTEGFHYCAAPDGGAAKRCWTRPGPPTVYCDRNPTRTPGVVVTPIAPAWVRPEPTTWMSYACLANADNAGGCGTGQAVSATSATLDTALAQVAFYGVDGNMGDYLGDLSRPGILLEGMTGTIPGATATPDFAARLESVDPDAIDAAYAPETYDAVIIAALASEIARSSAGVDLAVHLPGVTTRGERCTDFAACRALVQAGTDIDYDGLSGPLDMTSGGELARAVFTIVSFGADNRLDRAGARSEVVGDAALASAVTPVAPSRETAPSGGALRIGALLPETGPLAFLGPGMRAAADLAVADINAAGGVNGEDVVIVHADEGGFGDEVIDDSLDTLLAAEVDVVIGAASSGRSFRVIDQLVEAGVAQVSPSNTADAFADHDDDGLYFRTAAADRLQARALAETLVADGRARVAVLALTDDYALLLAERLDDELVALGLPSASIATSYYAYEGPYDDALAEVLAHDPDAVVLLGFDETRFLIALLADLGLMPAP